MFVDLVGDVVSPVCPVTGDCSHPVIRHTTANPDIKANRFINPIPIIADPTGITIN
jgi:hypothetical protein